MSPWDCSMNRSMALWHRKEQFSHLQAWTKLSLSVLYGCAHKDGTGLTAMGTNKHVRWAIHNKKKREIAENCDNCGIAENCEELRT